MSLDDVSAVDLSGTNTAVVWTLWSREASYGPSIRFVEHIEECVLLLETEPGLVRLVGLHELSTLVTVVVLVWGSIRVPALSDDQDVGGATEWIGEDSNGSEVDIRVVARSLTGRAAIEIPLWKIFDLEDTALWDRGESLIFIISESAL